MWLLSLITIPNTTLHRRVKKPLLPQSSSRSRNCMDLRATLFQGSESLGQPTSQRYTTTSRCFTNQIRCGLGLCLPPMLSKPAQSWPLKRKCQNKNLKLLSSISNAFQAYFHWSAAPSHPECSSNPRVKDNPKLFNSFNIRLHIPSLAAVRHFSSEEYHSIDWPLHLRSLPFYLRCATNRRGWKGYTCSPQFPSTHTC